MGQLVPTTTAARAIYLAVLAARHEPRKRGYELRVVDSGDHWEIFQYVPSVYKAHGKIESVTVTMGGGALELTIDKCTGAMDAAYSR